MRKKKPRSYFGESTATSLCGWLNNCREHLNKEPKTLRLRHFYPNDKPVPVVSATDADTKHRQVRELYQLIELATRHNPSADDDRLLTILANTVFDDLKFSPVVDDIDDMNTPWKVVWVERQRPEEGKAAHDFLELAQQGLLPRLRQCAYCDKWFFARFSHTTFHSIKCRDAAANENMARREKRRTYERQYYRDFLSKKSKGRR